MYDSESIICFGWLRQYYYACSSRICMLFKIMKGNNHFNKVTEENALSSTRFYCVHVAYIILYQFWRYKFYYNNCISIAGSGPASVLVAQYQFTYISIPSTIFFLKPSKRQAVSVSQVSCWFIVFSLLAHRMYGLFQTMFFFSYMGVGSVALGILCGESPFPFYCLLTCMYIKSNLRTYFDNN